MRKIKFFLTLIVTCMTLLSIFACLPNLFATKNSVETNSEKDIWSNEYEDYMNLKNYSSRTGVPLGGLGVGSIEYLPDGSIKRILINNQHQDMITQTNGTFLAVWESDLPNSAHRLQRDDETSFGMKGYQDTVYTGLFPTANICFSNPKDSSSNAVKVSSYAYSSLVPHDVKNSSLPAVFFDVTLTNTSSESVEAAVAFSWSDIIGRGLRDTTRYNEANFNWDGESDWWNYMSVPTTSAENYSINGWKGVRQYIDDKNAIKPNKWTFQNYNTEFSILAKEEEGMQISSMQSYQSSLTTSNSWNNFINNGTLTGTDGKLSDGGSPTQTTSASAISVKTSLNANEEKKVRFMLSWFMEEPNQTEIEEGPSGSFMEGCSYGRYYHNYFNNLTDLNNYATGFSEENLNKTLEYINPILESNLPSWLKFKEINSSYTLFINSMLNKEGSYSTMEGSGCMGGLGGTMDQKLNAHPFMQKFFTELDLIENEQFANNQGPNGEILHFDCHYYNGILNSDPNKKNNTMEKFGSMICNSGSWLGQLYKYYLQTNDKKYLEDNYSILLDVMDFTKSKMLSQTQIPSYHTTYDDSAHPDAFIYSGTLYLAMLKASEEIANIMGDEVHAIEFKNQFKLTSLEVDKLFVNKNNYKYYCYGGSNGLGSLEDDILFTQGLSGYFLARYNGLGDLHDFNKAEDMIYTVLSTSIQNSNDYFASKKYNIATGEGLDSSGSHTFPFMQDAYVGMSAIQLGYVEDGLKTIEHTQLVQMRNGCMWLQNIWSPTYGVAYMTAPVSWRINDVLAGSVINLPNKSITLGMSVIPGTNELVTPLYYPEFWGMLRYNKEKNTASLEIIKTFGSDDNVLEKLIVCPNGVSCNDQTVYNLDSSFTIKEGETLDLSKYCTEFNKSVAKESILEATSPYSSNSLEVPANGNGLYAEYYSDSNFEVLDTRCIDEEVNFTWEEAPHSLKNNDFSVRWSGAIQPKFSQDYTFTLTYNGKIRVRFQGEVVIDNMDTEVIKATDAVFMIPRLEAGTKYPIEIEYVAPSSSTPEVEIKWWSTSQTLDVITGYRMYSTYDCDSEGYVYIERKGTLTDDFKVGTTDLGLSFFIMTKENTVPFDISISNIEAYINGEYVGSAQDNWWKVDNCNYETIKNGDISTGLIIKKGTVINDDSKQIIFGQTIFGVKIPSKGAKVIIRIKVKVDNVTEEFKKQASTLAMNIWYPSSVYLANDYTSPVKGSEWLSLCDKDSLKTVINSCLSIDEDKYSPVSYNNYIDSLNEAKSVYGDIYSSENEIREAKTKLISSIGKLAIVDMDEEKNVLIERTVEIPSGFNTGSSDVGFSIFVNCNDTKVPFDFQITGLKLYDQNNNLLGKATDNWWACNNVQYTKILNESNKSIGLKINKNSPINDGTKSISLSQTIFSVNLPNNGDKIKLVLVLKVSNATEAFLELDSVLRIQIWYPQALDICNETLNPVLPSSLIPFESKKELRSLYASCDSLNEMNYNYTSWNNLKSVLEDVDEVLRIDYPSIEQINNAYEVLTTAKSDLILYQADDNGLFEVNTLITIPEEVKGTSGDLTFNLSLQTGVNLKYDFILAGIDLYTSDGNYLTSSSAINVLNCNYEKILLSEDVSAVKLLKGSTLKSGSTCNIEVLFKDFRVLSGYSELIAKIKMNVNNVDNLIINNESFITLSTTGLFSKDLITDSYNKVAIKDVLLRADVNELQTLLNECDSLNEFNYSGSSWNEFVEVKESANRLLTRNYIQQYEVDSMCLQLYNVKNALVETPYVWVVRRIAIEEDKILDGKSVNPRIFIKYSTIPFTFTVKQLVLMDENGNEIENFTIQNGLFVENSNLMSIAPLIDSKGVTIFKGTTGYGSQLNIWSNGSLGITKKDTIITYKVLVRISDFASLSDEELKNDPFRLNLWNAFSEELFVNEQSSGGKSISFSEWINGSVQIEPADLSDILEKLKEIEKLNSSYYTEETWNPLDLAVSNANKGISDVNVTQIEVNRLFENVNSAFNGLEHVPVDRTELIKNISKSIDLCEDDYTEESWNAFQEALSVANNYLSKFAPQDEITMYANNLNETIKNLVKLCKDKSSLKCLLDEYDSLILSNYTTSSWAVYSSKLLNAIDVYENDSTYEEVENAKTELKSAHDSLVEIEKDGSHDSSNDNNASSTTLLIIVVTILSSIVVALVTCFTVVYFKVLKKSRK